jgi:hypothetical protein
MPLQLPDACSWLTNCEPVHRCDTFLTNWAQFGPESSFGRIKTSVHPLSARRFDAAVANCGAGEDHRAAGGGPTGPGRSAAERMFGMTDHIMKTLLNIMAALFLGAIMILFVVL